MQDNIPDALVTAFERHYDCSWNDPALRNERLAWRAAWAEATKPCLTVADERAAFETAYATEWSKNRSGNESVEQLAAEIKGWREGETYPDDMPYLKNTWDGYQWAHAALAATPAAAEWCLHCGATASSVCQSKCANRACPQGLPSAAAPVVLPEPVAWMATPVMQSCRGTTTVFCSDKRMADQWDYGGHPEYGRMLVTKLLAEPDVRALLAGVSAPAVAVPDGWREKFATDVYNDLAAADNQDVPLEEYPARIIKVLDSIVGPRHPVVIKWRNDAVRSCIAISYKYCRDPESQKYLKQDLEAMLTAEPAPKQADARGAAFEAVRKKFCKLQRYSFFLDDKGNVRRTADCCGNWVEFEAVHTLFEPCLVDAAIAAAKGESQ